MNVRCAGFIATMIALPLVAVAGAAPGNDWPMFRHDPQLSGRFPLTGGFQEAPREAWSVNLGPRIE